jgi:hypothetical protein
MREFTICARLVAIVAAIFGAVQHFSAPQAYATPTMTVDYETSGDGYFVYLVTNTSPQNPDYEMNKFILPAGTHQGVYSAIGPDNWNFSINLDETVFSTITAPILPDGGQGVFELYSNVFDVTQRDSTAYTRYEEPFNPVSVDVPVNEKTLSADLNDDGIVNGVDYAILVRNWMKRTNTDLTSYEQEVNGLKVCSYVVYDPSLNMNIFDYLAYNNSGDTFFNNIFFGEQWVDGGGVHQLWEREVTEDFIRFYGNLLNPTKNEEFIAGSSLIDTWGIGPAKFESDAGNTFYVDVLIPLKPIYPEGDINKDGSVDWIDLSELCNQWFNSEGWYTPK